MFTTVLVKLTASSIPLLQLQCIEFITVYNVTGC